MNFTRCCSFLVLVLLAGPAVAQVAQVLPPGAYRTAAAYHRHQPQPGGINAFYPNKRGQVVVVVPRGPSNVKLCLAPDSLWGYVSGKGHTTRLYRGQEYRLEAADTLCVYSSAMLLDASGPAGAGSSPLTYDGRSSGQTRYFFSRGLNGFIFPLSPRYLREMYAASNPAFATALGQLRFDQSLADYDRKTGLYRVTSLYREALAR